MSAQTIGRIEVGRVPPGTREGDWEIRLDGEKMDHVTAADDVRGMVERYVVDAGGRPTHSGGHFTREKLRGKVTFVYLGSDPRYAAFSRL